MSNGKIDSFMIPTEMDKTMVGLIKSFVKMFSPLLDKDLYIEGKPVSKSKKVNLNNFNPKTKSGSAEDNSTDSFDDNSTNETDESFLQYDEENTYSYE